MRPKTFLFVLVSTGHIDEAEDSEGNEDTLWDPMGSQETLSDISSTSSLDSLCNVVSKNQPIPRVPAKKL